jgi:hypothetical protein
MSEAENLGRSACADGPSSFLKRSESDAGNPGWESFLISAPAINGTSIIVSPKAIAANAYVNIFFNLRASAENDDQGIF